MLSSSPEEKMKARSVVGGRGRSASDVSPKTNGWSGLRKGGGWTLGKNEKVDGTEKIK